MMKCEQRPVQLGETSSFMRSLDSTVCNTIERQKYPNVPKSSSLLCDMRTKSSFPRRHSCDYLPNREKLIPSSSKDSERTNVCVLRSVRFGKINTIEIEPLVSNLGEGSERKINERNNRKLKNKMWYSKFELDIIASDNVWLADKAIMKGVRHVDSKNNETIRGLENMLLNNDTTIERQFCRQKARTAVLLEQQRQKILGINDPDSIKSIYKKQGAKLSQHVASQLGLHDEGVANQLQQQQQTERKNNLFGAVRKLVKNATK